jgi:N-acyl-D-aspartate/D-glutamate deacylase
MKRAVAVRALAFLSVMAVSSMLAAQDLVIINARIIKGTGEVIDQGSIVIREGRLASVGAGPVTVSGVQTIDARGLTAIAGFIDGHRHINTGPNEKVQMQQLLEAGYTTILSGGGPAEGNLALKDHID